MRRWLAVAAAVVAAWQAAPAGAGGPETPQHVGHAEPMDLRPAEPAPDSIYQLDSLWTTPDGRRVPLSSLAGRVQVLAMIYTHCEHACPRIIADMRRLRRELGDQDGRVGYALVSLDPARDDAARLAAFAAETGLGAGWTLLRAEEGDVRELATALGIRYRRVSESDFLHSNLLSVLDARGVVAHRQVGLGVDPAESAAAIRALLAARE